MSKNKQYSFLNILLWVGWPFVLTLTVVLMFFTCSSKRENKRTGTQAEQSVASLDDKAGDNERKFRMIGIPDSITSSGDRMNYLMLNYWNNFDFGDTLFIDLPEVTEQAFADYLDVLNQTRREDVVLSINKMLSRAQTEDRSGRMYAYFLDLFNKYTYDPNSPLLNEELYIPVTEYIESDEVSDFATKERAKFAQGMMLKNRIDTRASDFKYQTLASQKGSLSELQKDYTLLYIYNPDCPSCKETIGYLSESTILNHFLDTDKLDVLAVYPDDELSLWREYAQSLPSQWIHARDVPQQIRSKQLYNLRALPTIYLLDKNKKVLLKDTNVPTIERYLSLTNKTI